MKTFCSFYTVTGKMRILFSPNMKLEIYTDVAMPVTKIILKRGDECRLTKHQQ